MTRKISSAEATKRWRERNPAKAKKVKQADRTRRNDREKEIARQSYYRTKYGLTEEEYFALRELPCEICGKESDVVDHCHTKGHVRAPLCNKCNRGLGHFDDSPHLLRQAALYLERHV